MKQTFWRRIGSVARAVRVESDGCKQEERDDGDGQCKRFGGRQRRRGRDDDRKNGRDNRHDHTADPSQYKAPTHDLLSHGPSKSFSTR